MKVEIGTKLINKKSEEKAIVSNIEGEKVSLTTQNGEVKIYKNSSLRKLYRKVENEMQEEKKELPVQDTGEKDEGRIIDITGKKEELIPVRSVPVEKNLANKGLEEIAIDKEAKEKVPMPYNDKEFKKYEESVKKDKKEIKKEEEKKEKPAKVELIDKETKFNKLKDLFKTIVKEETKIFPDININEIEEYYVTFKTKKNYAEMYVQKKSIKLFLKPGKYSSKIKNSVKKYRKPLNTQFILTENTKLEDILEVTKISHDGSNEIIKEIK